MLFKRLISSLACAAFLAGCATQVIEAPKPLPKPALSSLMTDAELAINATQPELAITILKSAANAYPGDKTPWLRMAQVQFDCQDYGAAITSAQQVIELDPDDILAHSLLAVSGLRVSSKALADLTQKNNLSGTVRAEAQDLAKLLRASIGGDIIVPITKNRGHKQAAMKEAPRQTLASPAAASRDNPFESLK